MTIWQIIIWWLITEMVSWGVWYYIIRKTMVDNLETDQLKFEMDTKMSEYPATQDKTVEWIRFIIWPYGIIQRTIIVKKLRKELINER